MNEKVTSHFTNYGVNMQPEEADAEGFLHFRHGFEELPRETWTDAERWVHAQCERIDSWREGATC